MMTLIVPQLVVFIMSACAKLQASGHAGGSHGCYSEPPCNKATLKYGHLCNRYTS